MTGIEWDEATLARVNEAYDDRIVLDSAGPRMVGGRHLVFRRQPIQGDDH